MVVEKFKEFYSKNLLIVDVQKSFSKFFTDKYLKELNKYSDQFENVYQIWDNHIDGKDVDKDFLYEKDPEIPINGDLYHFNNQKDLIEKRYNYNVRVDFYQKILSKEKFTKIRSRESSNEIKKGESFKTDKETYIVFVGNKHRWVHIGIKLVNLFLSLKGKEVTIVGGSDSECLEDIFTAARSLGVNVKRNWRFIYSANHCPIK
jgi:hypothetical protein